MDSSNLTRARVLDVTVLVTEGSFASTAVAPIEIFHSAGTLWNAFQGVGGEPRFRVRIASVDGGGVNSSCSLGLVPQVSISDVTQTDIVLLPASGLDIQDRIMRESALVPWLRERYESGSYIAGICTGVAFLAESGLLDGRRGTTHWAAVNVFRERYPQVQWCPDEFVTEDGRVLCSGGVYAAVDLSLYLVEKFCGHEIALQCSKALLLSMPRLKQAGYGLIPISRPHADDKIRAVEEYLRDNFERSLSVDYIANRFDMTERTFIRRFKAATGRLPGGYVQALRVAAAREFLERGSMPIATVCAKIGYDDIGFFRGLFKRHTGMTPSDYRAQFANMRVSRGELLGDRLAP
ncbi:transcriptional regulator GlxA family with amidase domain [Pelomonas saccharophila]|uniref:Transcriptional regulator GlxA family with amidase domain n=1 Tax=Roseateles saccharophilus TaxID=304 RepID=A0ABU1YWH0_ROSSA|nr:helix-turn-helix domain-containing protein [Roseateles saccharophilus]MDR7273210.1 transcriptional regulator GlxA family with amidase domain [Roseateles saccharophilus]